VRKIGQIPPQQIEIAVELSDRLGIIAGYYKKALISREQGYGIAAIDFGILKWSTSAVCFGPPSA
jgi:hypothetical protein